MRQLIIVRKDLPMSSGKMAAQVSHASMAFMSAQICEKAFLCENDLYKAEIEIPRDVYEEWFSDIYTKTICEAKNRNQLMKAVAMAEALNLREGKDFFLIRDVCLTELEPEELDENGCGCTLTCIGFRPLPDDIAHQISRKFQLYR